MTVFHIFDLDGTVIDSSHRYRNKPCGSIDLEYWIDNCTAENIERDSLLPMADKMRSLWARNEYVLVCTARAMEKPDFEFLNRHGLYADAILHRQGGSDMRSDADLKEQLIDKFLDEIGYIGLDNPDIRVVMYEDNLTVIDRLRTRGVICCVC